MAVIINGIDWQSHDPEFCVFCEGTHLEPLGVLGDRPWYRCRDCGLTSSVEPDREPSWCRDCGAMTTGATLCPSCVTAT